MEKSAADGSSMENRSKRKEILEAKKARYGLINAACSVEDPLASFPGCVHYRRNGLSLHLESGHGEKLSSPLKQSIRSLLKINMEGHYGREWPSEEKVKSREMIAPEARYIFVYDSPFMRSCNETKLSPTRESKRVLVGFAHYRFTLEEDLPVLYVYELQLEPSVQGKGLGKFLMQLLELIAHKNRMGAVVLTVQKANLSAMRFYIDMLSKKLWMTSTFCNGSMSEVAAERCIEDILYQLSHRQELIHRLQSTRIMRFCVEHSIMKPKPSWCER